MKKQEQIGRYTLVQKEGVFPLGEDALALGAFARIKNRWKVCDLGTGSGCLLLLIAQRAAGLQLYGVDREEAAVQTARENLSANALRGEIWAGDWTKTPFPAGFFDLVVSNPPYFVHGTGGDGGGARMETEGNGLNLLCRTAARLTRNGGRFALCARPDRLTDLLIALRGNGLEPKRLQFVSHSPEHPPYTVLVEAVRQGGPGVEVLPVRYRGNL